MSRMKESMLGNKNSVNWSAQATTEAVFKYYKDNGYTLEVYIHGQDKPIKCTSSHANDYQRAIEIVKQLSDGDHITYKSRGVDTYSSKLWFYSITKNTVLPDGDNLPIKETYICADCDEGTVITSYNSYYAKVNHIPYYSHNSPGPCRFERFGSFGDYDFIEENRFTITDKDLQKYIKILSDDSNYATIGWHHEHGIDSNLSNIMGKKRHPNFLAALNYYLKSEDFQPSKNVQERIGILYEIGKYGLDRNYKEAAKWYKKSLDTSAHRNESNDSASILLARLYLEGLGVNQDINKALELLKKSRTYNNAGNFLFRLKGGNTTINSVDFYLQLAEFYYSNVGANIDYIYGKNYVISNSEKSKLFCKWIDKHSQTNKPISLIEAAQQTMANQGSQESLRALYYLKECSEMGFGITDKLLWNKLIKQGCLHKYHPNGNIQSKAGSYDYADFDWKYSEYDNDGTITFEVALIKEFYASWSDESTESDDSNPDDDIPF
jgi:TPR repeat protein